MLPYLEDENFRYHTCQLPGDNAAFSDVEHFSIVRLSRRHPMHTHRGTELIYVLQGIGTVVAGDRKHHVAPGHCVIIPAGMPHTQASTTPMITLCLARRNGWLSGISGCWTDRGGILGKECKRLVSECDSRSPGYVQVATGILQEITGLVERLVASDAHSCSQAELVIENAIRLITERNGNITVDELSKLLHISPDHLRTLFRRYTGKSPLHHIIDYRIDKACELLRDTDSSIVRIAEYCGFSDQAYFTRTFRRLTGQTPASFRRGAAAQGGMTMQNG